MAGVVAISAIVALLINYAIVEPASETGGTGLRAVRAVREDNASSTSSQAPIDLPGSTVSITVPDGQTYLFVARLSGETLCTGGDATEPFCYVRLVTGGGLELKPSSQYAPDPADAAWDSSDPDDAESPLLTRSIALGPGIYQIKVQMWVNRAGMTIWLDDWHFTVEAYRK
ncbi:MAG: hypothetical protein WEB00_01065 [Dehalococcoidia bacterium]